MKVLKIAIPMAGPEESVFEEDERELRKAAYQELCERIPALPRLPNTGKIFRTIAVGSRLFLAIWLVPSPQLSLRLSEADWKLGRVVECDATLLDQAEVRSSVMLTRALLAAAHAGEPAAIREYLEGCERVQNRIASNRLRRRLGGHYELDVFESPEAIYLPGISPTRLEDHEATVSAMVTEMKGRMAFKARRVVEIAGDHDVPFNADLRQVWSIVRRGEAQGLASGRLLHESMERRSMVFLTGRFVVHEVTGTPVAMEVHSVSGSIPAYARQSSAEVDS